MLGDCDDRVDTVFPGNAELCDDVDQDCDGAVDEDADSDGDAIVDICDTCTRFFDATCTALTIPRAPGGATEFLCPDEGVAVGFAICGTNFQFPGRYFCRTLEAAGLGAETNVDTSQYDPGTCTTELRCPADHVLVGGRYTTSSFSGSLISVQSWTAICESLVDGSVVPGSGNGTTRCDAGSFVRGGRPGALVCGQPTPR